MLTIERSSFLHIATVRLRPGLSSRQNLLVDFAQVYGSQLFSQALALLKGFLIARYSSGSFTSSAHWARRTALTELAQLRVVATPLLPALWRVSGATVLSLGRSGLQRFGR